MRNTLVSLSMTLQWQDRIARHTAIQYFAKANLWRDILPLGMTDAFSDPIAGMQVHCQLETGEDYEEFDKNQIRQLRLNQFNTQPRPGLNLTPRLGRFYPRNFIRNEPAITGEDRRPMRIVALNGERITVDLNSPVAPYRLSASAQVEQLLPPAQEHGGRCNDFVYDMLQTGTGLQSCMSELYSESVDFFSGSPFARMDEREDAVFYEQPRIVHHLDAIARQHIERLYARFLQPDMQVLDLMSSWVSHIPESVEVEVTGLGMNSEELAQNSRLHKHAVHDLNLSADLPFDSEAFDLVVCTASVEYLIHPVEVFREVARCLKPGGRFVVTFSDRWFPSKAIELWSELHPYERMGLVSEFFTLTNSFSDMETLSMQHYPRPEDDKYSDTMLYSDPVFAVWATKSGNEK